MTADSQVSVRMQPACQSSKSTQASSNLGGFDISSEHVRLMVPADIYLRQMDAGVPKGQQKHSKDRRNLFGNDQDQVPVVGR